MEAEERKKGSLPMCVLGNWGMTWNEKSRQTRERRASHKRGDGRTGGLVTCNRETDQIIKQVSVREELKYKQRKLQ